MGLVGWISETLGFGPSAPYGAIAATASNGLQSPQQKRIPERRSRVSGSGTMVTSGSIWPIDINAETKGDKWYGRLGKGGESAKMMNCPSVVQAVDAVVNPPCAASWRFKPPTGDKTELGKEKAAFANWCFFEQLPWPLVIERMIHSSTVDGFYIGEMTDEIKPINVDRFPLHPGGGRGLIPTGIYEIPANTVSYWRAQKKSPTRLESIDQWQPANDVEGAGYRTIMADRLIRLTVNQVGANFAGVPILRAGWASWKWLTAFERYRAIVLERTAGGTPVATPGDADDYDKDEAAQVEIALENMRVMAKGAMVLPPNYKLEWSGAGENDLQNCNIAIESLKTDLSIIVTAGFLRLGLSGPGSYALSNTQAGQYHLSTVRRSNIVLAALQFGFDGWSPVKRIIEANYGEGTGLPVLQVRGLPTKDVKLICDLTYRGVQQGIIRTDDALEEEIRELIGIGPHDPDTARSSGGVESQAVDGEREADTGDDPDVDQLEEMTSQEGQNGDEQDRE